MYAMPIDSPYHTPKVPPLPQSHPAEPLTSALHLNKQRQPQRTHSRNPHRNPPRPNNLRIRELPPHIPKQMPHPIKAMKRKRHRQRKLRQNLRKYWPARKRRRHRRRIQMPAKERGDKIRGSEDVESARENGAREAVHDGVYPGYLGFVDLEVGTAGAVFALGDEDFVGVGGGEFLSC